VSGAKTDALLRVSRDMAKALVHAEHIFSCQRFIDNSEHVPRMVHLASAAAAFLKKEGASADESNRFREQLIDYARELFVAEWMTPLEGDEERPPKEKDAIACFDSHLKQCSGRD